MALIGILLAAVASFGFGAVYYMALSKPWMAAAGLSRDDVDNGNKAPYVIGFIANIVTAGILRHLLTHVENLSLGVAMVAGFAIGLFFIGSWIFLNNAFEGKSIKLSVINSGYAALGLAIQGAVLSFFI